MIHRKGRRRWPAGCNKPARLTSGYYSRWWRPTAQRLLPYRLLNRSYPPLLSTNEDML